MKYELVVTVESDDLDEAIEKLKAIAERLDDGATYGREQTPSMSFSFDLRGSRS